jgi:hypothetical protein
MLKALMQGGTFQERLSKLNEERIVPYRTEGRFGVDDAISHPRFGVGFVVRVSQGRIEVLFREGVKILIASASPSP